MSVVVEQHNPEWPLYLERFSAIKTARLVLREFVIADTEPFYQLESKPETARYQTWPPRTREQAQEQVRAIIQNASITPRSHVELAVMHDDVFIGRVGANLRRVFEDIASRVYMHVDLWFSFMLEVQGNGFATEAMIAFIDLLVERKREPGRKEIRLEIECDPRNTGSWKLAKRLGFERVSLTENAFECKGEWVGSLVYQKVV
jgi:RimJ/RimL family protein N-acetyltransferase